MFGEDHHDSIVQRGIDEALACRDLLQPAPVKPPLLARVLSHIVVAGRAITRRDPAGERPVTAAAPHVMR